MAKGVPRKNLDGTIRFIPILGGQLERQGRTESPIVVARPDRKKRAFAGHGKGGGHRQPGFSCNGRCERKPNVGQRLAICGDINYTL
jgi:hypothetical protein